MPNGCNGAEPACLQVREFKAELLSSGRKSQAGSSQEIGGWAATLHSAPLFPPEDPQADSSISSVPHLEAKIRQTHSLAHLLTKYAEQLLQEYVSGVGGRGTRDLGNREGQVTGSLTNHFLNLISQLWKLATQQIQEDPFCAPNAPPTVRLSLEIPSLVL